MEIQKEISRRRFIVGSMVAVAGFMTGCNTEQSREAAWSTLPPKDRISNLEFKKYPNVQNFDPSLELTKAIAQYYCQTVRCNTTQEQITSSVFAVGPERIVEEVEKEGGRKLTDEERIHFQDDPEIVTNSGLVYMNESAIASVVNQITQQQPAMIKEIAGRDLGVVVRKSILFHAYSHVNQSDKQTTIKPIDIPVTDGVETYDQLRGFTFVGKNKKGVAVYNSGANEAFTDYVGTAIGQDTGPYVSGNRYISGVKLVEMINNSANLPINQFIEFYMGRRPVAELLRVWGSLKNKNKPDEDAAEQCLMVIALRVHNPEVMSQEDATNRIKRLLNIP